MKYMVSICFAVITFGCLTTPSFGGCISECKDEYESEIGSCQIIWGDDPDDDDSLKSCIDDAKNEYESCVEECTS